VIGPFAPEAILAEYLPKGALPPPLGVIRWQPAVVDAGRHVKKFVGDRALVAFGAPNDLAGHVNSALSAAVLIHRPVAERFQGWAR
jgi:hypothetical protein